MAINVIVYWLDGLGVRDFDYHSRNGDEPFANKNFPQGWAFDHIFSKALGLICPGGDARGWN